MGDERQVLKGLCAALLVAAAGNAAAQSSAMTVEEKLEASARELTHVRAGISEEKVPMVQALYSLQDEVQDVRLEYERIKRQLDSSNMDLNNLIAEIKTRKDEKAYLSNLLSEYIRNFQVQVHVAELAKYREVMDDALMAPENQTLSESEVFVQQTALVEASIKRLQESIGGAVMDGSAVGQDGLVKPGQFALIGPIALFASEDGSLAGIAEVQMGSAQPTVAPFADSSNAEKVRKTVENKAGTFPFDPSLGNARKIEETHETLGEHLKKGGFVVYPIVVMFILAVLVAIGKWIQLALIPMPSEKAVQPLLKDMLYKKYDDALEKSAALKGPTAAMLKTGIEHINEPKDLVEEAMYEEMLTTRLSVDKWTSFIAVCASSAPLLGLLGTVTGIINTFKLITVFGSGDVKTLSGGISEALITTELGLVVAIFSLVLHAFLSRKAKGICDRMEQVAILFMNRATRSAPQEA